MDQNSLMASAQSGDARAVAQLMNRSLQKHNITATVSLEAGCLDIMLDHPVSPDPLIAENLYRALLKLNITPAYQTIIYGRKAGEHFATWSRTFELKPKPVESLISHSTHSASRTDSSDNRKLTLTLESEDGYTTELDLAQILGFVGAVLLILGVFMPIVSAPMIGAINYYTKESEAGIALIGLAIATIICLVKRQYSWVYGTGLWSLMLIALSFLYYQTKFAEIKSEMSRELLGNPFRGLAEAAVASVQLQWGWLILFFGAILVLTSAFLKKRNLDRQAFLAIGVAFVGTTILLLTKPTIASIQYRGEAIKAKQAEARQYIGTINRSQQSHRLEKNEFASTLEDLDLGTLAETKNYKYKIVTVEKDLTVVTATSLSGELRSYTGAVFVVGQSEETTQVITCESNNATQSAPATPILDGTTPKCAAGSAEPETQSK